MTTSIRARWLQSIAATMLWLAATTPVLAQAQSAAAWPSGPLKLVVPYAAGGGTDIVARLVAAKLAMALGRPVIVDNRPGGRSIIAYETVLHEPADGQTLLFNNSSHTIQAAYKGLRYDPATDFTPVSEVALAPLVFVVPQSNPSRTVPEFVEWTRKRPGKVAFGSFGVGTASHLAGEILNGAQGIDMVHVAYKGSAPALNDLLGEQIQSMFVDPAAAIPYVKSGRLKALAMTGTRRWKAYADVPTFGELGYKDLSSSGWWGLLAKKGTPPEIVNRLAAELKKIVAMPDVAERLEALGAEAFASTPQEFEASIRKDMARWKRVIDERNIVLE